MLLSSSGHRDGPIPPETRRMAGLLAREKTGEILAHLHRRPHLSASEVARLEDIHIATAQRYLKELVEAGLVGSRQRGHTPRPTEEYWLLEPRITIQIDLEESAGDQGMAEAARRLLVRDRGHTNVVYDTDPRTGDVQGLLILSSDHPRLVEDRIHLSATVGRFLARLPYAAGHAQSVWDTMQQAGLSEDHLPEILAAVGRFTAPAPNDRGDISGSKTMVPDADPPTDTETGSLGRSARPMDPELTRLFRSLAARDRLVESPQLPLLEVEAMDEDIVPAPGGDPLDHPNPRDKDPNLRSDRVQAEPRT